jgi:hypothetical protein
MYTNQHINNPVLSFFQILWSNRKTQSWCWLSTTKASIATNKKTTVSSFKLQQGCEGRLHFIFTCKYLSLRHRKLHGCYCLGSAAPRTHTSNSSHCRSSGSCATSLKVVTSVELGPTWTIHLLVELMKINSSWPWQKLERDNKMLLPSSHSHRSCMHYLT